MASIRILALFLIVVIMIDAAMCLTQCSDDVISKVLNSANSRGGEYTCMNMDDIKSSLYRNLGPLDHLIVNLMWQLSFHSAAFGIGLLIYWFASKPARKQRTHHRHIIARYDMRNAALIAKRAALIHRR
ncbi:hypothetical protein PRIPAC_96143, partial [Pristionchus pacificus]|uniref:Uncharacterized protein n=1 Tax=Pristionchus pacificus TaxID=54126 RepID=A0A2A6B370_PRIPA